MVSDMVQIPLWSMNTVVYPGRYWRGTGVQIPLWSMNTLWVAEQLGVNSMFRFLYGRWIHSVSIQRLPFCRSSDSSMVDEYGGRTFGTILQTFVQIPLWSMNTPCAISPSHSISPFRFLYGRWIPFFPLRLSPGEARSDSSMVDEYLVDQSQFMIKRHVQIPLWSMNTHILAAFFALHLRFRFLYGRWIPPAGIIRLIAVQVQIPLWSMNTQVPVETETVILWFRFLYGRWIQGAGNPWHWTNSVQIPLWSMNTQEYF